MWAPAGWTLRSAGSARLHRPWSEQNLRRKVLTRLRIRVTALRRVNKWGSCGLGGTSTPGRQLQRRGQVPGGQGRPFPHSAQPVLISEQLWVKRAKTPGMQTGHRYRKRPGRSPRGVTRSPQGPASALRFTPKRTENRPRTRGHDPHGSSVHSCKRWPLSPAHRWAHAAACRSATRRGAALTCATCGRTPKHAAQGATHAQRATHCGAIYMRCPEQGQPQEETNTGEQLSGDRGDCWWPCEAPSVLEPQRHEGTKCHLTAIAQGLLCMCCEFQLNGKGQSKGEGGRAPPCHTCVLPVTVPLTWPHRAPEGLSRLLRSAAATLGQAARGGLGVLRPAATSASSPGTPLCWAGPPAPCKFTSL